MRARASTVYGHRLDDADRSTGWSPDAEDRLEALAAPVSRLVERARFGEHVDRLAIVPDAHYPFHPSTGMVTDPAVVGALAAALERAVPGGDVAIAGSSDYLGFERATRYLGYQRALEHAGDVSTIDLADSNSPRVGRTVSVDGKRVSASVPTPLLERTVIVVPSLRPTRAGPVAGATRTLERCVECGVSGGSGEAAADAIAAVAAARAVDPAGALLDATTAYAGHPVAADALLAGDCVSIDAVAAALLGRDPGDDGALALATGDESLSVSVDGLAFDALRSRLSSGDLPEAGDPHPAVSRAYRLYASVSGDAVPPQLEGESGVGGREGERVRNRNRDSGNRSDRDR